MWKGGGVLAHVAPSRWEYLWHHLKVLDEGVGHQHSKRVGGTALRRCCSAPYVRGPSLPPSHLPFQAAPAIGQEMLFG